MLATVVEVQAEIVDAIKLNSGVIDESEMIELYEKHLVKKGMSTGSAWAWSMRMQLVGGKSEYALVNQEVLDSMLDDSKKPLEQCTPDEVSRRCEPLQDKEAEEVLMIDKMQTEETDEAR